MALSGLAVGAVTALAVLPQARERWLPKPGVKTWGEALIGGPFALTDQAGRRVTDRDFRGRTMLVVFGATTSPDVTPAALQVLGAALDRLGAGAERFVPILITVDPRHDAPEKLGTYVQSFSPRLVALTGTPAEIAGVLRAYRVHGARARDGLRDGPAGAQEPATSPAVAEADPTPLIYVMDASGRYRTRLNAAAGVDAVAASLAEML